MCINKVIEFSDFLSFYSKYKPLTPYGIAEKDNKTFYTKVQDIKRIHNITQMLIGIIKTDENKALKVAHHLSRIDRLNNLDKADFDVVDLHLIKRFLIHFNALDALITSDLKALLGFSFKLHSLWQALMIDNNKEEAFYLSSAYSEELKQVREDILLIDEQLNQMRQHTLKSIQTKYNFDFKGREFILVNKQQVVEMDVNELIHEFYDSELVKIKPAFGKQYLDKLVEKEELLIKESAAEKKILVQLSNEVKHATNDITDAVEAIKKLDVHLAKARLSIQLQLNQPIINSETISVDKGQYYPLWEKHQVKKLDYTPLTASFDSNAILLSGSNMGGKTVLFKTLAFMQLLTQMGFYVPAKQFQTKLFEQIHILGNATNNIEGLSSFGQEIHQLTQALDGNQSRLLFVDELAKTTNATEAKAILFAVLSYVQINKKANRFFSTHFMNVPDITGVSKYQMKGLNKEAYAAHCKQQSEDINEKIGLINAFMQYEVMPDNEKDKSHDALTIAGMLGLNKEILTNANDYLDKL